MVKQGDIIKINFDPQMGHEQKGRRPAVIVSNNTFNKYSRMYMVCPITNTNKRHPFHIELNEYTKTTGVILCDQARILDINARNFQFIEVLPDDLLNIVINLLTSFIRNPNE